jgi:hypothetical protein
MQKSERLMVRGAPASGRESRNARWGMGTTLALVSCAVVLMAGCGKHQDQGASAEPVSQTTPMAQPAPIEQVASDTNRVESGALKAEGGARASEILPPELTVSVADSVMFPGQVIEIAALGTNDVTEMALGDRLGQKQPFIYDTDLRHWRAAYRIPLGTAGERIALSVTARNSAGKWHRKYVFLNVGTQSAEVTPAPAPGK